MVEPAGGGDGEPATDCAGAAGVARAGVHAGDAAGWRESVADGHGVSAQDGEGAAGDV